VVIVLWVISKIPVRYAVRRLLIAELFIVSIALLSLLSPDAAPVFYATLLKSNICIASMVLLTWTTPFSEIMQTLRKVHMPSVMLTTMTLMYRYLPVLAEESRRMQRARASRTFTESRHRIWQNLTMILAQLFIRSVERAERIYLAMCARGWK
jgi:cobalt/nickel transport system permease protein